MTLYYSPFFDRETFRRLSEGKPVFEKVTGNAGLLSFLELRLGLSGTESDTVDRILAYQKALGACLTDAFYAGAFRNDPLSTAKEILRWRDLLILEGFDPSVNYTSSRLRKLSDVESIFCKSGLVGTAERWRAVRNSISGPIPNTDIQVYYEPGLLPKLIREVLEIAEASIICGHTHPTINEERTVEILHFNEVTDAYRWAAENNDCEAVICPYTYQLNAVLRSKEKPLVAASSSGKSSISDLVRMGLSILKRPVDVRKLADYLRAPFSPINDRIRYALAGALLRDGGKGEKWTEALKDPDETVSTFLIPLLDADIDEGKVSVEVVKKWCNALRKWAVSKGDSFARLAVLCSSLVKVLDSGAEKRRDVEEVIRIAKTLEETTPAAVDKALVGSWDVVESHRCFVDIPKSLLWMPANGGIGTAYPYDFLLGEEREELGLKTIGDFVRSDFSAMSDLLSRTQRIILCVCDFDCGEALEEHPAVTLLKTSGTERDMRSSVSAPSIFRPVKSLELDEDLNPDHPLSATSLDDLINYPFDYVMKKTLRLRDITDTRLSPLNIMEGTVAHAVFESMMDNGNKDIKKMQALLDDGTFTSRVDDVAEKVGATLLLPENRSLYSSFRETLAYSIGVLLDILEKSGLKPCASEEYFNEDLDCGKVVGYVDFYAHTANGDIVIIDFKYSSGSYYISKLKKDNAIQLEIYKQALGQKYGKKVVALAYYFFPTHTLYTTETNGVFRGDNIIRATVKSDQSPLKQRLDNSVSARKEELKRGYLEVEEGFPIEENPWHLAVADNDLIDVPSEKGNKEFKAFSDPNITTFPVLKNQIK